MLLIKRITLLAIALLMLTSAACSSNGEPSSSGTDGGKGVTSTITKSTGDGLPPRDFGGEQFRTLNHRSSSWNTLLIVEEQDGDVLNDTVYTLNSTLEERFNFNFAETLLGNVDASEAKAAAEKLMLAGEDAYDLILMTDRDCLVWAQEGLILSMYDLPYVDLGNEWWSPTICRDISIGGKLYFAYGDFNLTAYTYTFGLAFNKAMLTAFGLDDPYALVNSGAWTLDRMTEMMVAVTDDLNGDSKMDENDRFGFSAYGKAVLPNFWIPAGLSSISKDANDLPIISMGEKFISFCQRIYEIMYDQGVYIEQTTTFDGFKEGSVLFSHSNFGALVKLRGSEFDFGILPFPKADEKQQEYYSRTGGGAFTVVPVTAVSRSEMISVILEAWASGARASLIPVFYETVMKIKVARDEDSLAMLDIIFNNRVYDLGDTFWNPLIRDGFLMKMFTANDRNLASAVEANRPIIEKSISATVEAFAALR